MKEDVERGTAVVPEAAGRARRGTLTVSLPADLIARLRVVSAADGSALSRTVEQALAPFVLDRVDAAVARLAKGENA